MDKPITSDTNTTIVPKEGEKVGDITTKTFTQDELNSILQKRLADEGLKSQKAIEDSVMKAIEEERRVAGLSAKEKDVELQRKADELMKSRDLDITLRENKIDFITKLNEAKLPIKFVDFILDKDPQVMQARFEVLKNDYANAIAEGISNQLKGTNATKDPLNNNSGGIEPIVRIF